MNMELKDMCKFARKKRKMLQSAFAKMIHSNQTEISFIERGFIPTDKQKIELIEYLSRQTN